MKIILVGKKARDARKEDINNIMSVLIGNRGWKDAFLVEFPAFNNSDGLKVIQRAYQRTSSDEELLKALTVFYKRALSSEPDWFKKQFSVNVEANGRNN